MLDNALGAIQCTKAAMCTLDVKKPLTLHLLTRASILPVPVTPEGVIWAVNNVNFHCRILDVMYAFLYCAIYFLMPITSFCSRLIMQGDKGKQASHLYKGKERS